jgi:predicted  nucleic acid-binding Zn-ribbon protein
MSDKERLEKFESYLNEFEHACRGGDYEASEHLKTLIIQTIEQQQQEIERLNKLYLDREKSLLETISVCENFDEKLKQAQEKIERLEEWDAIRRDRIVQLEDQLEQVQDKVKQYEKALREIANEQEVGEGDFNADDVANNLIATAKQALEGDTQ